LQSEHAGAREIAGLTSWELVVPDGTARSAIAARARQARWPISEDGDRLTVLDPDGMQLLITA
jgi:hypothetical protein